LLSALPCAPLGLALDNNAVRIAVGLRLGTPLCHSHQCVCGEPVDALGTHGLSCIKNKRHFLPSLRTERDNPASMLQGSCPHPIGANKHVPHRWEARGRPHPNAMVKRKKPHRLGCSLRRHLVQKLRTRHR
jgi:hypothetical protein